MDLSRAPRERPLNVFAFDPSLGRRFGNHHTVRLPYEPLAPGPVGRLVAVIDEDIYGNRHPGVDLDDPSIRRRGGLAPAELDRRFHQQMVYAVVMQTIHRFEIALGRAIVWPWSDPKNPDALTSKLRVYPHHEVMLNASVDTERHALVFGSSLAVTGPDRLLPPEHVVHFCLSNDAIVHETVHVLLLATIGWPDREEDVDIDIAGLHEGICDLVSLLLHFSIREAVLETIQRTAGRIHDRHFAPDLRPTSADAPTIQAEIGIENPLLSVGLSLGKSLGGREALRSALSTSAGLQRFEDVDEPHARGSFLVAAVFDALLTIYARRTHDLRRLAGGKLEPGALHPDLASRMAHEAQKTAGHFLTMCIRALDYCPPVTLSFGDYLRALVSADSDLVPDDDWGYRTALVDAFRARGIYADGIRAYAADTHRWPAVRGQDGGPIRCDGLEAARSRGPESDEVRVQIQKFVKAHARDLGLMPSLPVRVNTLRSTLSQRVGPRGRTLRELVVLATQRRANETSDRVALKLILDDDGQVRHAVARHRPGAPKRTTPKASPEAAPSLPPDHPLALPDVRDDPDTTRPLKIFAFDPSRGRRLGNFITIDVPREQLEPGPVSEQIAVVDYDSSNDRYYQSVNLDDASILLDGGLDPTESDPRFHQQMVYAVATATIRRFEIALGRPVNWFWNRANRTDKLRNRLRIFPHAMQEANAYYQRDLGALVFGYFAAPDTVNQATIPGQTIFTCLSHDIIAHETTHAILDSVQPYFLEPTGPDVIAFHEAFADVVAILQHFSFKEALLETILRTGGRIHASALQPTSEPGQDGAQIGAERSWTNPMVELAREFGEGLGARAALRSALGAEADPARLAETYEPHDRGAILLAAIFDAFFTVYSGRAADLLRLARAGGVLGTSDDLHPDLANRLAREAAKTARHFLNICVRALDYCPPVDLEFGDFLRAVITADAELVPDDPWGYRQAIIDAFRHRGIFPKGAASMSEESLRWPVLPGQVNLRCEGLEVDAYDRDAQRENARLLHAFGRDHLEILGLSPNEPWASNRFHGKTRQRADPNGSLHTEFVAQLAQRRVVPLWPDDPASPTFTFRGGTTIILGPEKDVRYVISRPLDDEDRLARQRAYMTTLSEGVTGSSFVGLRPPTVSLAALHRGY